MGGRPLSESLPVDGLPAETVVRFGVQIAGALAHAHERGVIHRDLKTANVVVAEEHGVKVLDFGLARRIDTAAQEDATRTVEESTESGTLIGTVAYIAPSCSSASWPTRGRTSGRSAWCFTRCAGAQAPPRRGNLMAPARAKPTLNRRRAARLAAVQALYQVEVTGERPGKVAGEFTEHRLASLLEPIDPETPSPEVDREWFRMVVVGAWGARDRLDAEIERCLTPGS